MRLIAAAAAALVILGVAASVAQGSTGDPVVLGQANGSDRTTTFYGTATGCGDCTNVPTVAVEAQSPDRIGLAVQGGTVASGGLTLKNGLLTMSNAQVLGVAAGERKAVYHHIFDVPSDAMVLTDLRSPRPNLWVTAAVPEPGSPGTVTVYLNRVVSHPVLLTVAVIGTAS